MGELWQLTHSAELCPRTFCTFLREFPSRRLQGFSSSSLVPNRSRTGSARPLVTTVPRPCRFDSKQSPSLGVR
jgi:hypothetical protein